MSATTSTLNAVTELVRARLEAVPIYQLIVQPTQKSTGKLINQLSGFASHFSSSKWGGVMATSRLSSPKPLTVHESQRRHASIMSSQTPPVVMPSSNSRRNKKWSGKSSHSKPSSMKLMLKPSTVLSKISSSKNYLETIYSTRIRPLQQCSNNSKHGVSLPTSRSLT